MKDLGCSSAVVATNLRFICFPVRRRRTEKAQIGVVHERRSGRSAASKFTFVANDEGVAGSPSKNDEAK